MTVWYLLATLALVAANAFFVALEFAVITSRREKLEPLVEQGRLTARLAIKAVHELSIELAGAQLGVTMASLGLGVVGEPSVSHLLESALDPLGLPHSAIRVVGFAVALVLVAFLHLVLGEMVPKNVALAGPERVLLALSVPNLLYTTLFRPVIVGLDKLANAGVRLSGIEPKSDFDTAHSAADLAVMLAESRQEGLIPEFDHDLLSGALGFAERRVSEVMIPRSEMVTVRLQTTVGDVERIVVERGHSRLPVLGRDLDDVLGFIHVKDLLPLPAAVQHRLVRSLRLRRMLRIPADETLEAVLLRMQRSRLHLAAVVDGGGATVGLVSLEDVLESLVGAIRDESDVEPTERVARSGATESTD